MDFRPILHVIGVLLSILAASMMLPMLIDLYDHSDDWKVFGFCIVITAFFGGALLLSNSGQGSNLSIRQAFMLTVLSWISICAFGALPFRLSELEMSYTDAFFEAMSGITTTGATVIVGLENAPRGILLWRGILNFLGGLGFIVMAMSVLPILKVGGMRLFRTESSEREKALPRAAHFASSIAFIYIGLAMICALCFMLSGLGLMDSLVHAMAAIATGGFSNYDSSFGAEGPISGPLSKITAIVFMLIGGMPFILYIKAFRGNATPLLRDTQVRWFITVVLTSALALTAYLVIERNIGFLDALLRALFNVTSIITSTGFVSEDYSLWGSFAVSLFFFLAFIGGCSGSTSGGIKIFRFQVLFAVMNVQIKRLLHPHGVFIPHYNGRPIPKDVPLSVMGFFFVYILTFSVGAIGVSLTGQDFLTSVSAVIACLSNVGPGLGSIVGPAGTFAPLSDVAKWILSACMLIGRLELFTILVMLSPHFWRR